MNELSRSFNESADDYLRARSQYPSEMIEHIINEANLDPNSKLLDIGCGSGQATMAFSSRGYQVVAIDPAQQALNHLAERNSNGTKIELVHSSLEEFEAPEFSFDLIICAQAFHWLDPKSAATMISRLLRPQGHVMLFWHMQEVAFDSEQAELFSLNTKYFDTFPRMNPPEYSAEFLEAMSQTLCRQGAITNIQVSEYPWVQGYQRSMFVSLFKSWSKYVTLPKDTKEAIDLDLESYLDSITGAPQIKYRTCLVHGQKAAD